MMDFLCGVAVGGLVMLGVAVTCLYWYWGLRRVIGEVVAEAQRTAASGEEALEEAKRLRETLRGAMKAVRMR